MSVQSTVAHSSTDYLLGGVDIVGSQLYDCSFVSPLLVKT